MSRLTLDTAPIIEPVTLSEAKQHLNILVPYDDAKISTLIKVARRWAEYTTNRALNTQTWILNLDEFPAWNTPVKLPLPPIQSVTHVKYYDENGDQQTLSSSKYTLDLSGETQRIFLNYNEIWPNTRVIENAVEIKFVAGYTEVPEDIKHAIKIRIERFYNGNFDKDKEAEYNLLNFYRVGIL